MLRSILSAVTLTTIAAGIGSAEETGTITGRVVGSDTRAGIAYVGVLIMEAQTGGQTNRDGRFSIAGVQPGTYVLRLKTVDYLPLSRQISVHPGNQNLGTFVLEPKVKAIHIVGTSAKRDSGELSCEVRLAKEPFVGDPLHLALLVHNQGSKDVVLPYGLDGSDGRRYPMIQVRVEGPEQGFVTERVAGCGPVDALAEGDLVAVGSGQSLDPLSKGWLPSNIRTGRFEKAGTYTAIVSYSTRESDARRWVGAISDTLPLQVSRRLRRVPLVVLADTLTFEVKDKRKPGVASSR